MGSNRFRGTTPALDEAAVQLRRSMTQAEARLWSVLRGRKAGGLKFRRQHPVGPYVLDFYCAERRLAVEVDGAVHDEQRDYDAFRSEWLWTKGIRVIRFRNADVFERLDWVVNEILRAGEGPHPGAARRPSPKLGEGDEAVP